VRVKIGAFQVLVVTVFLYGSLGFGALLTLILKSVREVLERACFRV